MSLFCLRLLVRPFLTPVHHHCDGQAWYSARLAAARHSGAASTAVFDCLIMGRDWYMSSFKWRRVARAGAHAGGRGRRLTRVGAASAPPARAISSPLPVFSCPVCGLSLAACGLVWRVVVRASGVVPSSGGAAVTPPAATIRTPRAGTAGAGTLFYSY